MEENSSVGAGIRDPERIERRTVLHIKSNEENSPQQITEDQSDRKARYLNRGASTKKPLKQQIRKADQQKADQKASPRLQKAGKPPAKARKYRGSDSPQQKVYQNRHASPASPQHKQRKEHAKGLHGNIAAIRQRDRRKGTDRIRRGKKSYGGYVFRFHTLPHTLSVVDSIIF